MSVKTDDINLRVNIGGDTAKQELVDLVDKARLLREQMKGLTAGTEETTRAKAALREELKKVTERMTEVRKEVGLNGLSMRELSAELTTQTALWRKAVPDSIQQKEAATRITEIKGRMEELSGQIKKQAGEWDEVKKTMAGFSAGALIAEGAMMAVGAIKNLIMGSIKAFTEEQFHVEQLRSTLNLLWHDSDKGFKDLTEQAEKLSKANHNLYRQDDIIQAQEVLAVYGLQSDKIKELMPIIQKLAASMQISLPEAAEIFTKGIEGQGRELKKHQIIVSATATASENLAAIVKGVTKNMDDAVEVYANSQRGQFEKIGNDWKDAGAKIGNFLLNTGVLLQGAMGGAEKMSEAMQAVFGKELPPNMKKSVVEVKNSFTEGAKELSQFNDVYKNLTDIQKKQVDDYKRLFKEDPLLTNTGLLESDMDKLDKAKENAAKKDEERAKKQAEADAKALKAAQELADKKAALLTEYNNLAISLMTDESLKALAQLEIQYNNKKAEIEKIHGLDIDGEKQRNATLLELEKNYQKERQELIVKTTKETFDKEYTEAAKSLKEWYEHERLTQAQALAAKQISESQASSMAASTEKIYLDNRLQMAKDYGKSTEEVDKDIADYQVKQNKASYELEERALMATLKLRVEMAKQGTKEYLDAQINLLKAEMDKEIAMSAATEEEKELIRNEYLVKIEAAEKAFLDSQKTDYAKYAKDIESIAKSIVSALNDLDTAQLDNAKAAYDKQKTAYKAMLDSNQISRKTYDADMAAADATYQQAERKAAHDKAIRDRDLGVFSTAVSTAEAIGKALASGPPPENFIMAALAGAAGVAQEVAVISKPIPALSVGGYTSTGDSAEVAGIVHKNEWVAPAWMVQHPQTANIIGMLEANRKTGFAGGGYTGSSGNNDNAALLQKLTEIHESSKRIETHAAGWKDMQVTIPDEAIYAFQRRANNLNANVQNAGI